MTQGHLALPATLRRRSCRPREHAACHGVHARPAAGHAASVDCCAYVSESTAGSGRRASHPESGRTVSTIPSTSPTAISPMTATAATQVPMAAANARPACVRYCLTKNAAGAPYIDQHFRLTAKMTSTFT
jgi:hypothetical protein